MAKKYIDLVLDTIESDYSPVGVVKQLDSVIFNITVTENSTIKSLNNQNIKLFCKKPDKTKVEQTEGIDITNSTNGELTIDLKNSALQAVGLVYFELELKDSEGTISTANFIIRVDEKLGSNEAIESTNEFDTFEKIKLEEQKRQESEKERDKIFKELITEGTEFNGSLENNINLAETLNTNLAENIKLADPLNTSLNEKIPEAAIKKTELENSINKAKEFIDGLDGSQNIPGIRMELTELQNGLKSNQSLEYEGSSISANDTLEGRTEGMKIKGRTLQNLIKDGKGTFVIDKSKSAKRIYEFTPVYSLKKGKIYKGYIFVNNVENTSYGISIYGLGIGNAGAYGKIGKNTGIVKFTWNTSQSDVDSFNKVGIYIENTDFENGGKATFSNFMLFEEGTDLTYIDEYFEGIKSLGEAEQEEDKFKVSLLSHGKNILKPLKNYSTINGFNLNNILKNGVQYTVTNTKNQLVKIAEFKDADTFLGQSTNGKFTFTFDNSKQQKLYIWKKYDSQVAELFTNEDIDFVMIEEGTGTIFEPYKEDKKDILISSPLPGFDFGEDIMYEENGQVKITRNIDNYIFTGDEVIRDTTEQDEKSGTGKYKVFVLTINKTIDKNKNINNNFPKKQFSVAFQKVDSEGLAITQYGVYIKILKSKLSTQDAEGLKAWLKANQTVIYFARATPVTEIVENCVDIDLDTYQEKTYFNILNSLPGTLDFKVPSNLGSVVQNMSKEINNIWDVIDMLVAGLLDAKKDLALKTIKNNLK
ncbi:BppU family phage baseplate upper protein [Clostridium perfringens]|uniref:BppU family phage baseplate upper protein n=1 Tax=Clostridium perfringens TaxID=1502 RepID=UPI001ABB772E|nr:BppU family phage baseplate upper protein [Clostridium perfringens]MBO3344310.1 BppU family phage baseplate upper protein [Clostridium perfringens]MBO3346995.1 BppU family phage baseplate upper protein [Clostridium perfringens]MBO3350051.1 BppU family phage baseplate upper protein [Clostridium perfringens]MBO3370781.1 BppU family phage baseplate upper protein [Clostridium perfringens]